MKKVLSKLEAMLYKCKLNFLFPLQTRFNSILPLFVLLNNKEVNYF